VDKKGKGAINFYLGDGQFANGAWFDLKSGTKYRLCFSGVGRQLSLQLYDVGDLRQPVAQMPPIKNSKYTKGAVFFHANANTAAFALTLDNFFVTGSKP
jgi:hypothetical protein